MLTVDFTSGAKAAETLRMREAEVSKNSSIGHRVSFFVAAVQENHFKVCFGCSPDDVQLNVVSLQGYDGKFCSAVLLQWLEPMPRKLPYYKLELYSDNNRFFKDVLLTKNWNLRQGQARERMTLACKHLMDKQPKDLTPAQAPEIVTLAELIARAKKVQAGRTDGEVVSVVLASQSVVNVASTLNEDDEGSEDNAQQSTKRTPAKKGGRKGSGRTPDSATKSRARSGSAAGPDSSASVMPVGSDSDGGGAATTTQRLASGGVMGMDDALDYK